VSSDLHEKGLIVLGDALEADQQKRMIRDFQPSSPDEN